jgi:hypothetical protein
LFKKSGFRTGENMRFKSILKELFKSDYKITSIKRYDSGLIKAQTSSLRWGDDFSLLCIKEEQIPYAKKCLAFLDAIMGIMIRMQIPA